MTDRRFIVRLLILPLACLLFIASSAHAQDSPHKNILILHSFHKGHVWNDSISKGIESGLAKVDTAAMKLSVYYEYMDVERFDDAGQMRRLSDFLKAKYSLTRFDVIIATDDSAFRFLLDEKKKIFPETPVVFCGVNYFEEFEMFGHDRFTGVVERIDILETVRTALRLHPKTKKILVVVDQTDTSIAILKTMVTFFKRMDDPSVFRFIPAMSMDELQEEVSSLPPDTVVLFVNFTVDRTGRKFSVTEGLQRVAQASNAPIYSFWDNHLGYGVVGGMMASGSAHGQKAAEIALRILAGTPVQAIPVFKESLNRHMFDYTQMARFQIREASLPSGAEVVNVPFSFYQTYKRLVWGIVLSIAFLGMIILILVVNTFQRKRVETSLTYYSNQLRVLNKIDRAVLGGSFSEETVQDVLRYVRTLYGALWACVVVFDFPKKRATVVAADTASGYAVPGGGSYPIDEFMPDRLTPGRRIVIQGVEALQNTMVSDFQASEGGREGYVSVPLVSNEELIGALNLSRFPDPGFTLENLDIIKEVATSLAVAIQSVNLMQATLQHGHELERLSAKVFEMQETTCRKISFELHDEIGQSLTAATLNLAAMEKMIAAGNMAKIPGLLADTEEIVNHLTEQAHDLSVNLWPPMLRDFGLGPTLRWYLNRIGEKVEIPLILDAPDFPERPSGEIETTVYRLAQEALNNVLKYAQATRVNVSLKLRSDNMIVFKVEDDGVGFDPEEILSGDQMNDKLGLLGMRERVAFLGGRLTIWSSPGQGTSISTEIPWTRG
ncbi:sensor histidine kinase [Desulfoluna limicola]|uniref:histidine kinase n=1 Tax=Desulfoluna limicola TaxID=2810562 RepID=A0ABM7PHG4_9BACT|nr:ATP-binding protein [Desulfoluna limicola]BCS96637.1 sensor histidine kinase [Desulfoluna limicola]